MTPVVFSPLTSTAKVWRDDVLAHRSAAERVGVTVAIERSRSGNGAHAWIFFAGPVPAATARQLGTILVAKSFGAATRAEPCRL